MSKKELKPFVIGAGGATDGYIGEYPELWNRRVLQWNG